MAKEDERQGAANKGKGKVEDVRELNGDAKNVKDQKTKANGKKDEEPKEGKRARSQASNACLPPLPCCGRDTDSNIVAEELSEEDQQLKSELEMLVERLKVG